MAAINRHASFFFFIYVCVACLLGIFGIADVGFTAFWQNLFTVALEILVGAGVTIFFIDRLNDHRATESLKRRLIREAGSRSNDIAISAAEWLRREGWLCGSGGLLNGEFLEGANLRNANLERAQFEGSRLSLAYFQDAVLYKVNMRGAHLFDASFQGAGLLHADLTDADLRMAQFGGSILIGADFQGANLQFADLQGAILGGNNFTDATLPDGSKYDGETIMRKFTESTHPEFRDFRLEKRRELKKQASRLGQTRPEDFNQF
ncbi:MAG: pentapeptide repeat-containing protein [Chloroflexota bacterium]|nr:pentapeptide repeat-containing protein [Chloroflexota bacterium]MDE2910569.1 pentapeptide repeat-containing protein [Chloroflexota bacterium]